MEPMKQREILWVSLLLLIPVFLAGMLFAYEGSRTDWIMHESIANPPSPALSASQAALGCDLEIR